MKLHKNYININRLNTFHSFSLKAGINNICEKLGIEHHDMRLSRKEIKNGVVSMYSITTNDQLDLELSPIINGTDVMQGR